MAPPERAPAPPGALGPVRWYASLRWQLTLSFSLLLGLTLAVAGAVQYVALRQTLLRGRSQSVEAAYYSVIASVRQQAAAEVRAGFGALTVAEEARLLATEVAADRIGIVLYPTHGRQILATGLPRDAQAADLPHPTRAALGAAAAGRPPGPALVATPGGARLIVVVPASLRTRPLPVIGALSVSAAQIDGELSGLRTELVLGGLVLVALALLVGLYLGARALRPLGRLTAAARAMAEGDLTQRSRIPVRGDEVGVLARVFDDMAASVERTVRVREEAEERMRQFVADASHELRTPLTAVKGYLDVLHRGASRDPEAVAQALPAMAAETERMRQIVQDLLTLARAEGSAAPAPQPVALDRLLRELLDRRLVGGPVVDALEPGVVALADPHAVQTIARNLLTNAERHAPGARVRLATCRRRGRVGFSCADDGPGIDPEDLPHLFERFYRADRARARRDGGSGLGLAIVQALATQQGGSVTVASGRGRGATFTVWLPAARRTGAARRRVGAAAGPADGGAG